MTYLVHGLCSAGSKVHRSGLSRNEAEAIAQKFVLDWPGAIATVDDERDGQSVAVFQSGPSKEARPREVEMPVRHRPAPITFRRRA